MKRCGTIVLGLAWIVVLNVAARAGLERVKFNHPGLTVDLAVGLWAWPLPMDYDGDGDLDLVVGGQPFLIGGDVVTAIDGVPVGAPDVLASALAGLRVGGRVTMSIARGGEVRDLEVGVIERPSQHADDPENPLDLPVSPAMRSPAATSRNAAGTRLAPRGRYAF